MKKMLTATATLALTISACAYERPVESYNENVEEITESDYVTYGNLATQDARIQGDIGPMRGIDSAATVQGYDDGDYTTMEVIAEDERGAVMHWLEFYGGLNHPALQPGNTLTFRGGNYPENEGEIHVEAMACQGPQVYAWDYDESASTTELAITEVEGRDDLVQVGYTTYVPDQNNFGIGTEEVSSGTFVLQR